MNHNDTRRETSRLIKAGKHRVPLRCDVCGGYNPEVNHLDYDDPWKVNFLCFRCHRLYHEVTGTPISERQRSVPQSWVDVYNLWRRIKAVVLLPYLYVRYFHRRYYPLPDRYPIYHYINNPKHVHVESVYLAMTAERRKN